MPLIGNSILLAENGENWRARRNAITPAFYRGKLSKMIDLAKEAMEGSLQKWLNLTAQGQTEIDLINEVSLIYMRVLLKTAIGESLEDVKVDYWEDGKVRQMELPFALRETYSNLLERVSLPHVVLFPQLAKHFILPSERDSVKNCIAIRALFFKMIKQRRALDPKIAEKKGDLLSILLTNDLFSGDDVAIVDECVTVFLAGS